LKRRGANAALIAKTIERMAFRQRGGKKRPMALSASARLPCGELPDNLSLTEENIPIESRFKTSRKGTGMSGTSAIETQNIAIVRRGYESFAKGDVETLKTLFSPNANWHAVGTGVLTGNYQGAQAILEFFGKIAHESNGTARVEPQTIAASGNHVFCLQRITGKRKGKTQDTQSVKGVVNEVTEFHFDHPAAAQFWS
jgi:uncharacterized protein